MKTALELFVILLRLLKYQEPIHFAEQKRESYNFVSICIDISAVFAELSPISMQISIGILKL